jgi:hypothetical protein
VSAKQPQSTSLTSASDSQKALATSLLTLLSHSHSSTSSLLAYVTSSPGVLLPVRRSVRHAAFEGPLSSALVDQPYGSQLGSISGDGDSPGWAAYVLSLEQFRKDLKQIHLLEEEMSRVKRDREILVTRLIKTTKSRPTKSDLSAIASSYAHSGRQDDTNMSSRASSVSLTSNGSAAGKEGKRTGKLQEAQAELLGCEEHLRGLEARIEHERNKVMMRGLEERFRAMDAVGRMWVGQAKRGLEDLDKVHGTSSENIPEMTGVGSDQVKNCHSTLSSSTRTGPLHHPNPLRRSGTRTSRRPPDARACPSPRKCTVRGQSPAVSRRRTKLKAQTTRRKETLLCTRTSRAAKLLPYR